MDFGFQLTFKSYVDTVEIISAVECILFWSRPSISDDMRDWILECFVWFDENFEPAHGPILPTKAFFEAPSGSDVTTAKRVLGDVKKHMKFDQPVEMLPLDVLSAEFNHTYQSLSAIAGTYECIDGISVIRYDPERMRKPLQFINLLAHELMHARLTDIVGQVPGGEAAHELATDLGCIISGFGVFQLQAADDAGWFGYLTQPSRAYALAVFLDRRDLRIDEVAPHLSPRCKKLMQRAFKELQAGL